MTKKEKELFFNLCDVVSYRPKRIKKLIEEGAATPALLGELFSNRMAATAYRVLCDGGLIGLLDRETVNSLRDAYNVGEKRQEEYFKCLVEVSDILEYTGARYALLKGAWLCGMYPRGCRSANDIDILALSEDIDVISKALCENGYRRGYVRAGEFVEADRAQIIEARMTRGEIVPFVKAVDLELMKFCEVDVNISLDYKTADFVAERVIKYMLNRTRLVAIDSFEIRTLEKYDFLLHLCAHLYKEATTLPWIKMRRDMTFYKFCDVYLALCKISGEEFYRLSERASLLGLEGALKYCLIAVKEFFGFCVKSPDAKEYYEYDAALMRGVIAPSDRGVYRYSEDSLKKRFFAPTRESLIERCDWRCELEKTENETA